MRNASVEDGVLRIISTYSSIVHDKKTKNNITTTPFRKVETVTTIKLY